MIQYGLISKIDAAVIEKTLDLICEQFPDDIINVCEVGVYGGDTGKGIFEYLKSKGRECFITGIDNNKDGEKRRFEYHNFIEGNSTEVYHLLENKSQHLIFDDADHSLIGAISDFFAYCDKVKDGGYFGFHDTAPHIRPFKDFQHGDPENPDAYISVRRALEKINCSNHGFKLIFDEYDGINEAGGVCVFKRID